MKPFCHHLCDFYCAGCAGEGTTDCPHCGNDSDCEECDGSGFDKSLIDFEEFRQNVKDFSRRDKKAGGNGRIEDLFEKGRDSNDHIVDYFVGKKTAVGEIRFSDFARDHRKKTALREPDMTFGVAQGGHCSLIEDLP